MAKANTIKIPAMKRSALQVQAGTKIDPIITAVRNRFTQLGCTGCLSGLNRLVIHDKIGMIK